MARPARPERSRSARSSRQLSRFYHSINPDRVFGTHRQMAAGAGVKQELIVQAALTLLDEVGLEGLTMRRLATALKIQAPSLYWHFPNKQALLDGMADAIFGVASLPRNPQARTWAPPPKGCF